MNKEKNIIIIIFSALGIFVLLTVVLYFNSIYGSENIGLNNNTKVRGNITENNTSSASSTADQARAKYKTKLKESILKEMDRIKAAAPKTVADFQKSVNDCGGLKNETDKNICITLWAEYKKDSGLCSKITEALRQDCLNKVAAAKATK
jgi:hypothetical protein